MPVTIYHNPRCSKSRQTLQLLKDQGYEPEIIEYLKTPLDKEKLRDILGKLGLKPGDIIRKKEKAYKETGLTEESSDDSLIAAMIKFPVLIERPIVVNGKKAVLGRPPENVLEIL